MKRLTLIIAIIFSFTSNVSAENRYTSEGYKIKTLVFYSKSESIYPTWSGVTHVHLAQVVNWNESTNCERTSVVIRNDDSHILSAVLTAYSSSFPIKLYVDDSLKVEGNFCYLRAVAYE